MRKKILSVFAVCFLLWLSAFTMFACGSKTKQNDVYLKVDQLFERIDQDHDKPEGIFLSLTTNGVYSDYAISYYNSDLQYSYYNQLFVVAINYLKSYYPDLSRQVKSMPNGGEQALQKFSTQIDLLSQAYDNCYESYNVYRRLSVHAYSPVVGEGALSIYRQALKELLSATYQAALALAEFKDMALNDFHILEVTSSQLTEKDTKQLRDYFVLQLMSDLYQALMVNLQSINDSALSGNQQIQNFSALCGTIKSRVGDVLSLQALSNLKNLTGKANYQTVDDESILIDYTNTKVTTLLNTFADFTNERNRLKTAMEQFNMLEYYQNYSCNLEGYAKNRANAKSYYRQINAYFDQYLNLMCDYLKTNLGA